MNAQMMAWMVTAVAVPTALVGIVVAWRTGDSRLTRTDTLNAATISIFAVIVSVLVVLAPLLTGNVAVALGGMTILVAHVGVRLRGETETRQGLESIPARHRLVFPEPPSNDDDLDAVADIRDCLANQATTAGSQMAVSSSPYLDTSATHGES